MRLALRAMTKEGARSNPHKFEGERAPPFQRCDPDIGTDRAIQAYEAQLWCASIATDGELSPDDIKIMHRTLFFDVLWVFPYRS